MKHLVVRTDIRRKLKDTRIVMVDCGIFIDQLETKTIDEFIKILINQDLEYIFSRNVKLVLYDRNNNGHQPYQSENQNIYYKNLNETVLKDLVHKVCISKNVNMRNIVLINSMECDTEILSLVGFSVSTIDAPLHVRSNSYYISNTRGTSAFNEIIDLIVKCKN